MATAFDNRRTLSSPEQRYECKTGRAHFWMTLAGAG